MLGESLMVARDAIYAGLEYRCVLLKDSGLPIADQIVVPSSELQIRFNISINQRKVTNTHYGSLIEKMGSNIAESPTWKALQYETTLLVGDQDYSFILGLKCRIFNSLVSQFDLDCATLNVLKEITVDLRFSCNMKQVSLQSISQDMNYLFCSWLLHIEPSFPLVFSFYGRQLFKFSYNWIKKSVDETFTSEMLQLTSQNDNYNKRAIILANVLKLQRSKMPNEFNLLSILAELSSSRQKYSMCKRFNETSAKVSAIQPSKDSSEIKKSVYRLDFTN